MTKTVLLPLVTWLWLFPISTKAQTETLPGRLLTQHNSSTKGSHWLTHQDDKFLSIWQSDRSGTPKGALLIVHDEGEHPLWPQTIAPLHNTLPDYGWATMAIHLPPATPAPIPKRTIGIKEDTNTTPIPNTETLVNQRLQTALQFLNNKGLYNIVFMGNGIGALRIHRFFNQSQQAAPKRSKNNGPIRALILYNAKERLPNDAQTYDLWFDNAKTPFLDIITTSYPKSLAKARKRLAKQSKAETYIQLKMPDPSFELSWDENMLSRRIRSFLDAYAQGVEVKKKN